MLLPLPPPDPIQAHPPPPPLAHPPPQTRSLVWLGTAASTLTALRLQGANPSAAAAFGAAAALNIAVMSYTVKRVLPVNMQLLQVGQAEAKESEEGIRCLLQQVRYGVLGELQWVDATAAAPQVCSLPQPLSSSVPAAHAYPPHNHTPPIRNPPSDCCGLTCIASIPSSTPATRVLTQHHPQSTSCLQWGDLHCKRTFIGAAALGATLIGLHACLTAP